MSEGEAALIAEMEAGLENCTGGPWFRETEAESDEEQPEVYVCSRSTVCDYTVVATMGRSVGIPQDRKQADAAHFARCHPDNIRTLISLIRRAEEKAEKAEAALKPFAEVADQYAPQEDDSFEVWQDAGPDRLIRASFALRNYRAARAVLDDLDTLKANSDATSLITSARTAGDSDG